MSSKNENNGQESFDGAALQARGTNHTGQSGAVEDRLHLRLSLQDLRPGAWISTRDAAVQRLWVVESITAGAGDGCAELILVPKDP